MSRRVTSGLLVALALGSAYLLRELLVSIFASTVELNLFGLGIVGAWSGLVVAAFVGVMRAREADPMFRDVDTENCTRVANVTRCTFEGGSNE